MWHSWKRIWRATVGRRIDSYHVRNPSPTNHHSDRPSMRRSLPALASTGLNVSSIHQLYLSTFILPDISMSIVGSNPNIDVEFDIPIQGYTWNNLPPLRFIKCPSAGDGCASDIRNPMVLSTSYMGALANTATGCWNNRYFLSYLILSSDQIVSIISLRSCIFVMHHLTFIWMTDEHCSCFAIER